MSSCKVVINGKNIKLETTGEQSLLFNTARNFFKGYKPGMSTRVNGVSKLYLFR